MQDCRFISPDSFVKECTTYCSDVDRIHVLYEIRHLPPIQVKCGELVQQTKGRGRTSHVTSHPRLHVVHMIVNLIDHLLVSLHSEKLFQIVLQS